MPTQDQLNAALQAGYTPQQIKLALARANVQKPVQPGIKGWLTDGKTGLAGVGTGAMNILNLPSYAIGGVLNQGQRALGSKYGQQTDATGLGILEGIKNKRAVFTEAPETFGIDPNSRLGKAVGFGAELLTPSVPLGGVSKLGKVANFGGDAAKIGGKVGGVTQDIARTLIEKSYKLSASDIDKIADAIGVTDESQKAIKVIDYLEGLGLKGSNRGSLQTLNKAVKNVQEPFNALTRSGGQVSRQPLLDELLNAAIEAEKVDTPASRALSKKLFDEAYAQSKRGNKPLTDTDLTDRISTLFREAGDSAISDSASSNLSKGIAKAGQKARETLRPGSTEMGRTLRGLRESQEVLGRKANTGLGTQLVNAFKPGAAGFGFGAVTGYSTGQNPLTSGLAGMVGGSIINRPGVVNALGKTLQKGVQIPKITNKAALTGISLAKKAPITAIRTSVASKSQGTRSESQRKNQSQQSRTYPSSITHNNVFKNKSAFGKSFKLKAR